MKIIHVSDLHLVKPGHKVWGVDPLARLDACLADIARHHADADFCVISGDLTDRGEVEAYELVRDRLANFPLQTHLLIGNHDIRENFFAVFPDAPRDPTTKTFTRRLFYLTEDDLQLNLNQIPDGVYDPKSILPGITGRAPRRHDLDRGYPAWAIRTPVLDQ